EDEEGQGSAGEGEVLEELELLLLARLRRLLVPEVVEHERREQQERDEGERGEVGPDAQDEHDRRREDVDARDLDGELRLRHLLGRRVTGHGGGGGEVAGAGAEEDQREGDPGDESDDIHACLLKQRCIRHIRPRTYPDSKIVERLTNRVVRPGTHQSVAMVTTGAPDGMAHWSASMKRVLRGR